MHRQVRLTSASSDSVVGVHRQSRNVPFNVPTPKNEDRAHAFRPSPTLSQASKEVLPAVLGAMPVQLFLDEFMPTSSEAGTLSSLNPFRRILRTGSQSMLSGDGVNALNGRGLFAPVGPRFLFDDAAVAVVPEDQSELRKTRRGLRRNTCTGCSELITDHRSRCHAPSRHPLPKALPVPAVQQVVRPSQSAREPLEEGRCL
ncbi:hypothetical protein B0H21DRAFT_764464 [Amylocystis lapponica]|nr:hypothetical protein B0H21DRAFT_764464 [Amylocystis lapponica]